MAHATLYLGRGFVTKLAITATKMKKIHRNDKDNLAMEERFHMHL